MKTWIGASSLSFALLACGGTVVFDGDGGGGDGGAGVVNGASGVGTGSSNSNGSSGTSGSTTQGAGPGSSAQSGPGSSSQSGPGAGGGQVAVAVSSVGPGAGGGSSCSDFNYAQCLGSPDCVPRFDDFCCPDCFPGECADCVDFRAVACVDRNPAPGGGGDPGDGDDGTPPPGPPPEVCGGPGCGFVPDWACRFDKPDCSNGCFGNAGCVDKLACSRDECQVVCDAIAPDACDPAQCNAPPPPCGQGTVPEVSDQCWTGFCIPSWVCSFPRL